MARRITDAESTRMIQLYHEGVTMADIAEQMRRHPGSVRNHLLAAGIHVPTQKRPRLPTPKQPADESDYIDPAGAAMLVTAVIAQAVHDRDVQFIEGPGLDHWCGLIGANGGYVRRKLAADGPCVLTQDGRRREEKPYKAIQEAYP